MDSNQLSFSHIETRNFTAYQVFTFCKDSSYFLLDILIIKWQTRPGVTNLLTLGFLVLLLFRKGNVNRISTLRPYVIARGTGCCVYTAIKVPGASDWNWNTLKLKCTQTCKPKAECSCYSCSLCTGRAMNK